MLFRSLCQYLLMLQIIHVDHARYPYCVDANLENELAKPLRDFADWMYKQLETEYWWRMEDAQVDESIEANEYTFDENGNRKD